MKFIILTFFLKSCLCSRPNILLVISDDLRPIIGPYQQSGGEKLMAKTPNLDKFAESSTVFRHAYAQFPLCGPSRTSILTSRRPDTTKVIQNGLHHWRNVSGNLTALPQYFKSSGYHTKSMGKVFPGPFSEWPYSWSSEPFKLPTHLPFKVIRTNGNVKSYYTCPPNLDKFNWDNRLFCPIDENFNTSYLDVEIRKEAINFIKDYDSGLPQRVTIRHGRVSSLFYYPGI